MKITKRDTKRVIKNWTKGKSEYDYTIKEKYNFVYLDCMINNIKNGMSAKELQSKYKNYFVNAGTNFGTEIPMQVWKNLSLNRFEIEETEEEFQKLAFSCADIINILPALEEEIQSIKKLAEHIQNSKSDTTSNRIRLKDRFHSLFEIKK